MTSQALFPDPAGRHQVHPIPDTVWLTAIIASTAIVLLVSWYCLKSGITIIFMHLYYLPIVLLAYRYRARGFGISVLLGLIYVGMVYAFESGNPDTITGAWYRFFAFALIAAVVAYLSEMLCRREETIRESEEKYRAFFQTSMDCIFITSKDGKWVDLNDAAPGFFGYASREELLKIPVLDVYAYPNDREKHTAHIREKGYSFEYPVDLRKRDGSIMHALVTSIPRYDAAGNLLGYQGSIRDITERRKAEIEILHAQEENQAHERFLQRLIDTIPSPIFFKNKDGVYLGCNTAFEKYIGFPREQVIGKTMYDLSPKELADIDYIPDQKLLEKPGSQIYEAEVRGRDGSIHNVIFSKATYTDLKGNVDGIVGVILDITDRKIFEETAKKSRDYYLKLFDDFPNPIWRANTSAKCDYFNREWLSFTGRTMEQEIGDGWAEGVHPEDFDRCLKIYLDNFNARKPFEMEYRLKHRDGTYHWLLDIGKPFYDLDGNFAGYIGSCYDIEGRKRAEKALLESEGRLKTLIHSIPDLVWLKNAEGVFLECNPVFEKFFGAKESEIVGKTDFDFVTREEAEFFREHDHIAMVAGKPTVNEEWITFKSDGRRVFLETIKTPMHDDNGNLIGILGIGRDITERKLAQEALLESEQKFRDIFENANDAIEIIELLDNGMPGKYLDVNTIACRMLQYTKEELLQHGPLDISVTGPSIQMDELMERLINGEYMRFETDHRRKDGVIVPVEVNAHKVTILGRPVLLAITRDVTERKKAEALLLNFNRELEREVKLRTEELNASLQEKELLLREVHHRVKNNLQIILSLINLQVRQLDDPHLRQLMGETQNRVRAMSGVLERIYLAEDVGQVRLGEYIRFLFGNLLGFYGIDSKRVNLDLHIPDIRLDIETAIPLGLILNELISNSLKHAFPNGKQGTITISAEENGDQYILRVQDSGVGIPDDLNWKETRSLGFSLVLGLISQLGGTFAQEPVKEGSSFTMTVRRRDTTKTPGYRR